MKELTPWPWWASLSLKLGLLAAWSLLAFKLSGIFGATITCVGGMAVILPSYLQALAGWLNFQQRRNQFADWEGEYLEYQGQHLRAWRHGGELWMAARDLSRAAGDQKFNEARLQRLIPAEHWCEFKPARGMVMTLEGVRLWLDKRTTPQARKLLLWLERNVFQAETRRRMREPEPMLRKQTGLPPPEFKRVTDAEARAGSQSPAE